MSKYIAMYIDRTDFADRYARRKEMMNHSIRVAIALSIALALLAGVVPAAAQTVTLMEDNFGNSNIDERWRVRWNDCSEDAAGTVLWYNAAGACGNGYAYRTHAGDRCMIWRQDIDVSGYTNLKLTFWYRNNSGTSIEAFWRRVGQDPAVVSLGIVEAASSWTKKEYNLPDYNGVIRIRFDLKGSDTRRIDCVSVTGTLACPTPYAGPVSPSSTTVCPGTNVTFSLPDASGGDPNLYYEWWWNDSGIVGTGATHTTSTPGKYTCRVYNSCNPVGVVQTAPGYLYNHTLPAITSHPSNQTKCVGQTATFSVTASGSPAPTYQWQVRPSGGSWGNISGATSASYTTPTLVAGDDGKQYRCVATNTCSSATSNAATLTVNPLPTITSHPSDQSANVGGTATFSVVASDATGYQWQKNGSNISGATNSSYTTPSLTAADDGNQYRCIVSNACGNVTSNAATLTILADVIAVGMSNQAMGGGDWFYDAVTGAGQKGISDATGLNTVGMLIRVWGAFTYLDAGAFALDDGSGVTVRCEVPGNVTLDPDWQFVVVTGISSSYEDGGQLHRLIRIRSEDDITPLY